MRKNILHCTFTRFYISWRHIQFHFHFSGERRSSECLLINYSSKVFICFITYFFSLRIVFICTSFCLTVDISLKIKFKMFYCVQMYAAATDLLFLNLSYVKGPTSSTSCVLSKNLLRIFLKLSVFEKIYENLHFLLLGRARSNLLENAVTWILQGWNE